jgi:hypothetical protein
LILLWRRSNLTKQKPPEGGFFVAWILDMACRAEAAANRSAFAFWALARRPAIALQRRLVGATGFEPRAALPRFFLKSSRFETCRRTKTGIAGNGRGDRIRTPRGFAALLLKKQQVRNLSPDKNWNCWEWSGRQDSNLRPLAPEASALPG